MEEIVWISAEHKKQGNEEVKAGRKIEQEIKLTDNSEMKNKQNEVKARKEIEQQIHINDVITRQETLKRPVVESYEESFTFSVTCETFLFFKVKNEKVSISIRINLSCMRTFICVFDTTGTGSNLNWANISDRCLLESICQCGMPDIQSNSDTKLIVSETITVYSRIN